MGVMEIPPKREQKNDFIDVLFSVTSIILLGLGVWKAGEIAYFVIGKVEITIRIDDEK